MDGTVLAMLATPLGIGTLVALSLWQMTMARRTQAERDLAAVQVESARLEGEKTRDERLIKIAEEGLNGYKQRIEALLARSETSERRYDDLLKSVNALTSERRELQEVVERLMGDVKAARESVLALEAENKRLGDELHTALGAVDAANRRIKGLEDEGKTIRRELAEAKVEAGEVEDLRKKLTASELLVEGLEAKVSDLERVNKSLNERILSLEAERRNKHTTAEMAALEKDESA